MHYLSAFIALFAASFGFPLVHALQWKGADISSMINLENSGIVYRDNGAVTKLDTIIKNRGANLARIRIWTSSQYSQYNLDYALAMGRRVKAAGLEIMLDFHYSDTWADPGKQAIPSGWPTNLSGLNTKIYSYTLDVMNAFKNAGLSVKFVQIGNEINDGFLWPVGKPSQSGFNNLSQLLHSASSAVRTASPSSRIMIHLANGWKYDTINWFFSNVFYQGAFSTSDFDVFGFSMYPFYGTSATLSSLKTSLTNVVNWFNKDIIVVETDWAAICSGTTMSDTSVPISAAGQSQWVAKIRDVVAALPNGRGIGIVYWEPGWIGNANLGSPCADALLVESNGNTRSSISMFSSSM